MYLRQALQEQVQSVPSRLRAVRLSLKRGWQALALSERLLLPALRMSVLLAVRVLERLAQSRSRQRARRQSRAWRVPARSAPSWRQASRFMGSRVMPLRLRWARKPSLAMRTFIQRVWQARRRLAPLLPKLKTWFQSLAFHLPVDWDRLRRQVRRQLYRRGLLEQEKSPKSWSGEPLSPTKTRTTLGKHRHRVRHGQEPHRPRAHHGPNQHPRSLRNGPNQHPRSPRTGKT